ncbi:hypothetical protein LK09_15925 [Microbacterium mangrovi]|uniref:Uncharacterized protein n=1 Tax=Microbacterium mangrovi TaxID=1348253 RepID=A0A0B2A2V8_9MICO|nr:hypothetical protein [Microbacterium mangrovi]KHK96134.1 hypothetical protein LK09_15925 [Microbacterium mangrovi]
MLSLGAEPFLAAILAIFLFVVLCGALVLSIVSLQRPMTLPLLIAGGLVLLALIVVALSPVKIPNLFGMILAVLGTAVAVVGGNPVTRRVLEVATGGRVRETEDGGILVPVEGDDGEEEGTRALMRGGTVIGYLERIAVVISIIAGYPEAIAVVVAIKGIGRFSELASADARERFIIGTLASLLWACVVGGLVRLAMF